MNRLCAIGRLGADPETKTTRGGTTVLELRIAIDARAKQGEEWVTLTTWCRASLFGRRAEALQRTLAKGDRVGVTGALYVREFERSDGTKGFSVEILDADITLLGERREGGGRRERTRDARSDFASGGDFDDGFGGDDIPF